MLKWEVRHLASRLTLTLTVTLQAEVYLSGTNENQLMWPVLQLSPWHASTKGQHSLDGQTVGWSVQPCDTCHLELYPTANRRSHAPITYILFDCKFEKWPKRRVGIALVMQKNKNKRSKYIFIYLVKALLSPLCTSLSLWFIHQVVVWVCSLLGVNTNLKS